MDSYHPEYIRENPELFISIIKGDLDEGTLSAQLSCLAPLSPLQL